MDGDDLIIYDVMNSAERSALIVLSLYELLVEADRPDLARLAWVVYTGASKSAETLGRHLVGTQEFILGEGGEFQGANQFLAPVPGHPEQVHQVAVQIVINLGVTPGLPQKDRGGPAEGLHIRPVRRHVLDDPRGQFPLAAVPAKDRT